MGVGDVLELVREPGNPHDPLAVAVHWQGIRIGYVPRRANAEIARRLDAGERLVCRLSRLGQDGETWERVEVSVRQVPGALSARTRQARWSCSGQRGLGRATWIPVAARVRP